MGKSYAEDVRMALAEVAPELVQYIFDPLVPRAGFGVARHLPRYKYDIITRAKRLVQQRYGITGLYCDECAWLDYLRLHQDPTFVPFAPCEHVGATA